VAVGALATAAVDVVANLDTFEPDLKRKLEAAIKSVGKQVEKDFDKLGARAGKSFSDATAKVAQSSSSFDDVGKAAQRMERATVSAAKGMGDGFKIPLSDVQKLERAVQSASDSQADALGKVRIAEVQLTEARNKSGKSSSAALVAEERLATAQRNAARDARGLLDVTESLVTAREASFRAAGEAAGEAAGNGFGDGFRRTATSDADSGGRDAGGFFARAFETAASRAIGGALLKTFAAGVVSVVTAASPLSTVLAGGAAAVLALAGAIGQASGAAVSLLGILGALGLAAGTLKVGFTGVGDAMKAQSAAQAELASTGEVSAKTQKKLDDALNRLAPSAATVVKQLGAMRPAWEAVTRAVQERLFDRVATQLGNLGNRYLPILTTQLGRAAGTLNQTTRGFLAFLNTSTRASQISTIFSGLNRILKILLAPLTTVAGGFLDIFTKSLPFANQLATTLAGIGVKFGDWLSKIAASGQFTSFMQTAMTLAGDLFKLLGNLGSIIGTIFSAGASTGGGLLQVLRDLTGAAAAFLKSDAGQSALASFFDLVATAGQILVGVLHTLQPLLSGMGALFQALQPALQALGRALLPVISQLAVGLGAALAQLGPLFASLIVAITPLITTIGTALVTAFIALVPVVLALIQGIVPLVAALVAGLVPAINTLVPLFVQLAPILAQVVAAVLTGLLPAITALVPIIPQLVLAIVQLVQAFLPLIPAILPLVPPMAQLSLALVQMLVALLPLLPALVQMGTDIAGVLIPAVIAVVPYITSFVMSIISIVSAITNVISFIVRLAVLTQTSFNSMRNAAVSAIGALVSGVIGFISGLVQTATDLFTTFKDNVVNVSKQVGSQVISAIKSGLSGLAGAFRSPFDAAKTAVSGAIEGIVGVVSSAVSRIQGLVSKISGALGKIHLPNLGGIDIPGFAKGGIIRHPTLATFAERGPEAAIPLTDKQRAGDIMDQSGLTQLALERALGNGGAPDQGSGRVREINMPVTVAGLTKDETMQLFRDFLANTFGPRLGLSTAEGTV
jgi:phage-related protein